MLLTLTMPHDVGDSLKQVIAAVRGSFGALVAGKGWQSDKNRFGLRHYIRAHDCTHGPNGWHFHVHVLPFAEVVLTEDRLTALETSLRRGWTGAVVRSGFRALTREHGVRLEQARQRSDVARYICQVVTGD